MATVLRMASIASIIHANKQCLLIGLLYIAGACQQTSTLQLAQPDPTHPQPARIDWTMARVDGDKTLRIDYRVTNVNDKRIYLSDIIHTVQNGQHTIPDPQDIAVMNDIERRVVCFARGRIPSLASPTVPYLDPGARPVEPGQTVAGHAQVQLPLQAQSYAGIVDPLKWWPKAAVLQIGYFANKPTGFEAPLAEGGTLLISERTLSNRMEWLRSDIKPLP